MLLCLYEQDSNLQLPLRTTRNTLRHRLVHLPAFLETDCDFVRSYILPEMGAIVM